MTILDRILARKAEEVAERSRRLPRAEVRARAADQPPARGFAAALAARREAGLPAVIAEAKQASPSQGLIRRGFDAAAIARSYEAAGAACLSVLTDAGFFQGHEDDLAQARAATALPALRKDFTIDAWQVYESRAIGADALLLIAAALPDSRLGELAGLALEIGLDVLVEVHDAAELERALAVPGVLVGVNNRNLHTFEVALDTSIELAARAGRPDLISESGIRSREDVQRLRAAGIHGFLVGEACMRAADPGAALAALFGPGG